MRLDRADERVCVAAALGHPFLAPRDDVRQRPGVPPERNAATAATLGVAGADAHVQSRTSQADVSEV